jgi:hypothetical protein
MDETQNNNPDDQRDDFGASGTDETTEIPPQIVYGISIFMMDNNKPHVEVNGTPTALDLQMLLAPALANVTGNITAEKVVQLMKAEAQSRASNAASEAVRRRLLGGD